MKNHKLVLAVNEAISAMEEHQVIIDGTFRGCASWIYASMAFGAAGAVVNTAYAIHNHNLNIACFADADDELSTEQLKEKDKFRGWLKTSEHTLYNQLCMFGAVHGHLVPSEAGDSFDNTPAGIIEYMLDDSDEEQMEVKEMEMLREQKLARKLKKGRISERDAQAKRKTYAKMDVIARDAQKAVAAWKEANRVYLTNLLETASSTGWSIDEAIEQLSARDQAKLAARIQLKIGGWYDRAEEASDELLVYPKSGALPYAKKKPVIKMESKNELIMEDAVDKIVPLCKQVVEALESAHGERESEDSDLFEKHIAYRTKRVMKDLGLD